MRMSKFFTVLCIGLLMSTLVFAAGNKNDLAYIGVNELETASSVSSTDEVLIAQSDVPKQGITVADIQQVDMVGGGTTSATGYTVGVRLKNTTRNTTILASESGKTFICKYSSKFQLPAVAEGLTYTFVTIGDAEVEIQVNTTPDTIALVTPGDGDGTRGRIETGINTTGNTITLVSDGTDWYAMTQYTSEASWVDGGTWTVFSAGENE